MKEVENKKKSNILINITEFILIFIATFFLAIILSDVIIKLIAPSQWLFYEFNINSSFLFFILILIPMIYSDMYKKYSNKKDNQLKKKYFNLKTLGIFAIWSIILYIYATSVTFVTDNSIISYSPLNLRGTEYSYNEISKVEAKFGDKAFTLYDYKRKGSFHYIIHVDGKEIVFSVPTPNSNIKRYNDASYLELEELDNKLMDLNITKESSESNSEFCDLDRIYVERFLRIIRNN